MYQCLPVNIISDNASQRLRCTFTGMYLLFSMCRYPELYTVSFSLHIQDRIPFAVVGSNTVLEVNGKRVRARVYPWGVAEGNACYIMWTLHSLI